MTRWQMGKWANAGAAKNYAALLPLAVAANPPTMRRIKGSRSQPKWAEQLPSELQRLAGLQTSLARVWLRRQHVIIKLDLVAA